MRRRVERGGRLVAKDRPRSGGNDLTGVQVNGYTVIDYYGVFLSSSGTSRSVWVCRLDCGKFAYKLTSNILSDIRRFS